MDLLHFSLRDVSKNLSCMSLKLFAKVEEDKAHILEDVLCILLKEYFIFYVTIVTCSLDMKSLCRVTWRLENLENANGH